MGFVPLVTSMSKLVFQELLVEPLKMWNLRDAGARIVRERWFVGCGQRPIFRRLLTLFKLRTSGQPPSWKPG